MFSNTFVILCLSSYVNTCKYCHLHGEYVYETAVGRCLGSRFAHDSGPCNHPEDHSIPWWPTGQSPWRPREVGPKTDTNCAFRPFEVFILFIFFYHVFCNVPHVQLYFWIERVRGAARRHRVPVDGAELWLGDARCPRRAEVCATDGRSEERQWLGKRIGIFIELRQTSRCIHICIYMCVY